MDNQKYDTLIKLQRMQRGSEMVAAVPQELEWKVGGNTFTQSNNNDGCPEKRVGAVCKGV